VAAEPGADALSTYRSMRDFGATPEPPGMVAASVGERRRFVVQRHRATRLHYDLRLEVDGVMVSWAVPKGPTLDPADRRLAVKVEDHPLAYSWFEGNIASGYGKGDVIVWDDGWWEPDPEYPASADPAAALAAGELKFVLHGHKLGGRFVVVRTGHRDGNEGDQWLLLHKRDDHAVPGWDTEAHGLSVLSRRTNADVVEGRCGRWADATPDELAALAALGDKGPWTVDGVTQQLTNLDKVMMPGRDGEPPITKREVIAHYASVASWLTPFLAGRPVNMQRFPDGIEGAKGGFWHKNVPAHAPDFVRRWPSALAVAGTPREYLIVDGAPALVWAANYAGIELHPWTSTAGSPERPTFALVDIDPGTATAWADTLLIAHLYHVALDQLGVFARAKVTGKRGIQIWIPIEPICSFAQTSAWVEQLSRTVGRVVPELVSWQWKTSERGGKARLDYTQNALNKTLVAPYSIRPAPGAPVSVPIEWDELDDPDLRPDRWTIRDMAERLRRVGDPFAALAGPEARSGDGSGQRLPDLG
jgi:bifunctional non-homologous end joining protein LigD